VWAKSAPAELLHLCDEMQVNLVLSGHGHQPLVRLCGSICLVTAGSATLRPREGRGFPSFNVVTIAHGLIHVQLVDVSGGWGTQTLTMVKSRVTSRPHPQQGTIEQRVRVTPPLAFEAEGFHSQTPETNWRHQLGLPQTLGFPHR